MKIFLSLLITIICALSALGQITATTEDGKKVILNSDNTWKFAPAAAVAPGADKTSSSVTPADPDKFAESIFIRKNDLAKSEFETIPEYKQRLAGYIKTNNFNNNPLNETVLELNPDFNYDANRQQFNVSFSTLSQIGDGVLVNFVTSENYGDGFGSMPLDSSFAMSAAQAREVKSKLKAFVYGFPTRSVSKTFFYFYPLKVIVINSDSGEVYKSLEVNPDPIFRSGKPLPEITAKAPETVPDSTDTTSAPAPSSSGGPVFVRGYTRKDGTYVRPHTRSAPRKH